MLRSIWMLARSTKELIRSRALLSNWINCCECFRLLGKRANRGRSQVWSLAYETIVTSYLGQKPKLQESTLFTLIRNWQYAPVSMKLTSRHKSARKISSVARFYLSSYSARREIRRRVSRESDTNSAQSVAWVSQWTSDYNFTSPAGSHWSRGVVSISEISPFVEWNRVCTRFGDIFFSYPIITTIHVRWKKWFMQMSA